MRGYVDTLRGARRRANASPRCRRCSTRASSTAPTRPTTELAFGLDRILDGVEALVRRR